MSVPDRSAEAARLYRTHGPAVYRRCLRLLRDREAARDATQEVFVKLLRDPKAFDDMDKVMPWIYRVATNHCLNLRRDGARRGETPLDGELPLRSGSGGDAYPDRQLAQRVLSRFDPRTQAVAVGVLVDGLEHEELADALGVSRKTVSRTLARFLDGARRIVTGGAP